MSAAQRPFDHPSAKAIGKTGRTKSAAYLDAFGTNGHSFAKRTYHRPTYCQHCTDLLWGLTNQGVQCSVCNFVSHERCLSKLRIPCLYLARTLVKNPVGHEWYTSTYLRRKYCNVCRKLLSDASDLSCRVCDYYVHNDCKDSAVPNCIESATYSLKQLKIKMDQEHNWQEGNLPSGSKCAVCTKTCSSSECLVSMKCSWCNATAHSGCYEQVTKTCAFGELSRLVLPPFAVSVPNLSIWRRMSNEVKESSCSHLQEDDCKKLKRRINKLVSVSQTAITSSSDEILLSEHIDSDDEPLISAPSDSVHRSDVTNSIKIYDGKLSSPRMHKVVHASRTATAGMVLEEALRLYQITDDPSNYYLAKTLDQCSERTVDEQEMPLQFPNQSKKPMLFLRIKNTDKSGNIRVYLGIERNKTSFKTIKVQATTTVLDVIRSALEKLSLQDKAVDDYVLVMISITDGVKERVMENDECPWKILSEMKRRSIREMKFTRFYLRLKYEPCDSVVLCVSNLPTMLESEVYYSFLKAHLQNDEFTMDGLYPSSGTAFLSFSSPDKAARAMNDLEDATLSGKSLFVKLIPHIHNIHKRFHAAGISNAVVSKTKFKRLAESKGVVIKYVLTGGGRYWDGLENLSDKSNPLLVLVNTRSGGGQGVELLSAFQKLLNPHQVRSLSDGGPLPGLFSFRHLRSFRILVCGGDGTVGWALSAIDECGKNLVCHDPPVAILPLGTGNDLSRVLRWGAGYTASEDPLSLLLAVDSADTAFLDRWLIIFESTDTPCDAEQRQPCDEDLPNSFVMNNYFGIGIDAALSLDFHLAREEAPEKFTSRLHNKSVYFRVGLRNMVRKSTSFNENVELRINDTEVDLPSIEGIIVLNIASWGAGCDVWGPKDDKFLQVSCRDNLLEVVGVTGVMHMGQIKSGIRTGIRLGQGAKIDIMLKSELPVHIDGEPWYQAPGRIIIRPTSNQAKMLIKRRTKSRTGRSEEQSRTVVSSRFYSFDESGLLVKPSEENTK